MSQSFDVRKSSSVTHWSADQEDIGSNAECDKEAPTQHDPLRSPPNKHSSGVQRNLRSRSVMIASIGVGLAFIVFVAFLAISPPTTQRPIKSPLVGKAAPALSGTTITGAPFSLGSYIGHFVFVDFFASWCPACVTEQPQLNAFVRDQTAKTNGARLVGVIFGDRVSNIRSFLGKEVGKYPVLPDPTGTFALHWGVGNAAEMYLVGPNGQILAKIDGGVTEKELDGLIAKARSSNA